VGGGTDRQNDSSAVGPGVAGGRRVPGAPGSAWLGYDRSMLILQVNVRVKPEHVAAFREASAANSAGSLAEPGIARFDVLQNEEDPTRFMLVEAYRDRGAVAAHKETPHYRAWVEAVTPMKAEPRTRSWWAAVHPDDSAW